MLCASYLTPQMVRCSSIVHCLDMICDLQNTRGFRSQLKDSIPVAELSPQAGAYGVQDTLRKGFVFNSFSWIMKCNAVNNSMWFYIYYNVFTMLWNFYTDYSVTDSPAWRMNFCQVILWSFLKRTWVWQVHSTLSCFYKFFLYVFFY